jgi:iron complex transport system substrate-binding protein
MKPDRSILGLAFISALWLFTASAAPAADSGLVDGRTVVDAASRRLSVNKPFERIVCLYGAHAENLFALGAGDRIAGVPPHENYPPEAARRPVFSYHDDLEKFLAAKPDLVLIRPMIDRGYPQLIGRLEKNGIAVVSLQPGNVAEMLAYWEILGLLSGRRDEAAALVRRFLRSAERIRSLTADIAPRKGVYFEAIHDKVKTFSPQSMAVFALETAGGINVAGDAQPVRDTNIAAYGKERLLARAGEIDVYLAQSGTMNQPTIERIMSASGFQAIRAVREGRIHLIDERLVSRPTYRLLEGILAIGRAVYPDVFQEKTLENISAGEK